MEPPGAVLAVKQTFLGRFRLEADLSPAFVAAPGE